MEGFISELEEPLSTKSLTIKLILFITNYLTVY